MIRKGWGEFPVHVQIHFKDARNKRIDLTHQLKLDWTQTGLQTFGGECTTQALLILKPNDYVHSSNSEQQSAASNSLPQLNEVDNKTNNESSNDDRNQAQKYSSQTESQSNLVSSQNSLKRTLSSTSLGSASSSSSSNLETLLNNNQKSAQSQLSQTNSSVVVNKPSIDALLNLRPLNQLNAKPPALAAAIKPTIPSIVANTSKSSLLSNDSSFKISVSNSSTSINANSAANTIQKQQGMVIYKIGANDLKKTGSDQSNQNISSR